MADLESLLLEGESTSLDFKRDQYPFASAAPEAKAKLLKDILSMANAWRKVPAFILIGVDAEGGKSPEVIGISQHIDDAILQQFVNEKVNKTIVFSYRKESLRGHEIGVIEIPIQLRPIYLRNDFGGLRKNIVYFRRGSSNSEATPDEIIKMGAKSELIDGDLVVEFSDDKKRRPQGANLSIECTAIEVEDEENIPDYAPGSSGFYIPSIERYNTDYYRELVAYVKANMLLRKTALTITNRSGLSAQSIRVEFAIPDKSREWEFCEECDYPDRLPEKKSFGLISPRIKSAFANRDPLCEIEYSDGSWHLIFEFKDLQPQRTLAPGIKFYVGCRSSSTLKLNGRIFAEGLPSGGTCGLTITAETESVRTELSSIEKILSDNTAEGE